MSSNAVAIYEQVKHLDIADQQTLLERIALLVRKPSSVSQGAGLLSLAGLGAEIWRDENIDAYLNKERAW